MKLRAIEKKDLDLIRNARNEDISFLRTPYFITEDMQDEWYRSIISNRNYNGRFYAFSPSGVTPLEIYGDIFGYGAINPIQWENRIGEIGLMILPNKRKHGLGEQAVKLLLDNAFNQLNLQTVYGEYYKCGNTQFWEKVLKDIPHYETILKNRKFWDGKYWDSVYFSIERGAV